MRVNFAQIRDSSIHFHAIETQKLSQHDSKLDRLRRLLHKDLIYGELAYNDLLTDSRAKDMGASASREQAQLLASARDGDEDAVIKMLDTIDISDATAINREVRLLSKQSSYSIWRW